MIDRDRADDYPVKELKSAHHCIQAQEQADFKIKFVVDKDAETGWYLEER